jgi:aldose 1-epimerase
MSDSGAGLQWRALALLAAGAAGIGSVLWLRHRRERNLGPAPEQAVKAENAGEVSATAFGALPDGRVATLFTLKSGALVAKVTNYGATLTSMLVPDRAGRLADVVLGFDALQGYLGRHPHMGVMCGRFAGRIARGEFTLDGKTHKVTANWAALTGNKHCLHGGSNAWDKQLWEATTRVGPEGPSVQLTYRSPHGEEGFPGNIFAQVTYTLTQSELRIHMRATTDAPTVVNMAHHSYWNLAGHDAPQGVREHTLQVRADAFAETDGEMIPTGRIVPTKGTPLDLSAPSPLGPALASLGSDKPSGGGFDNTFALPWLREPRPEQPKLACTLSHASSGRAMDVLTTQPALQLYTANWLDGSLRGKGGVAYGKHQGLCLETQHLPDSPNHAEFPTTALRPGEVYDHLMVHRFYSI